MNTKLILVLLSVALFVADNGAARYRCRRRLTYRALLINYYKMINSVRVYSRRAYILGRGLNSIASYYRRLAYYGDAEAIDKKQNDLAKDTADFFEDGDEMLDHLEIEEDTEEIPDHDKAAIKAFSKLDE
uniref:uncharacterized protein LOC120341494 isoform X1 n=1 Tax=Styela clava TaxID=7725 RepID=UPI00193ABA14|nr:uncharacterized protein LOC120341494 isoform X1 [Styela clava]